jgi:hypothetical protein
LAITKNRSAAYALDVWKVNFRRQLADKPCVSWNAVNGAWIESLNFKEYRFYEGVNSAVGRIVLLLQEGWEPEDLVALKRKLWLA